MRRSHNGENLIEARGKSQNEAWWRASEQARTLTPATTVVTATTIVRTARALRVTAQLCIGGDPTGPKHRGRVVPRSCIFLCG